MNRLFKKLIATVAMATTITIVFVSSPAVASESSYQDLSDTKVTVQVYVNNYGEDFIKNIEFDDGTTVGDYDYTIEYINNIGRDAYYIPEYFEYCAWISREDPDGHNISLSLYPKAALRASDIMRNKGWNVLSDPYGGAAGSSYWPTDTQKLKTFHWQYDCHYEHANDKVYWNIEPSRSANSFFSVVLAGCNP